MNILYDSSDFEIKEFYYYPTCVVYRIAEWDEGFHKGYSGLNEDVKDLFHELLKEVSEKVGKDLWDNKIAMKIIHKPTNTVFYIGYKDWNWSIGLGLSPYMKGKMITIE